MRLPLAHPIVVIAGNRKAKLPGRPADAVAIAPSPEEARRRDAATKASREAETRANDMALQLLLEEEKDSSEQGQGRRQELTGGHDQEE